MTIGHGNLIAENGLLTYSGGRDLEIMGKHGVTVSHCPINIARRGRSLNSWPRYRAAGVNLALGSDTYPRDPIMNMRIASYAGKIVTHDLFAAGASEVFTAATLGGARALGRDDLGRLAPGAKADVVIIDLSGRDTLRSSEPALRRLRHRRLIRQEAQAAGEEVWARLPEWDPLGRTAEQMSPWSFPLVNSEE